MSANTSGSAEHDSRPTLSDVPAAPEASGVASSTTATDGGDTSCVATTSAAPVTQGPPVEAVPARPAPERAVKRPRLPSPATSALSPRRESPMKALRVETLHHSSPPLAGAVRLSDPTLPSPSASSPAAVASPGPVAPLAAHLVKVPVRPPQKTPVPALHSGVSMRGSPAVSLPPSPGLSRPPTLPGTPTSPVTTPSTPGATTLHQRWVAMLEKAFAVDGQPHDGAHVTDVCARIVASIPGPKAVAADTFLMLKANLADEKNTELRQRVLTGRLPVEVLVTLNEKDLVNPERRKELEEGFQERAKDTNITEILKASQTTSKLFPCPSCKVRDCTWMQKQTRSADEPMTVFCTCNRCGYKWRRF